MEERLVDPDMQPTDPADQQLRPQNLANFVGQAGLKDNLSVFIQAAKTRGQQLDHVLFFGPPGLGKTTLAQIVARELGVSFRATSGPILSKAGDLAAILTHLQKHDVLFIDEIHRLNPAVEEVLYGAMEDFVIDIMLGEGPTARTVRIDLPPFTLVGATTRLGMLSNPLKDRFGIPLRLQFYNADELFHIIMRASEKLNLPMSDAGAAEIARCARGTPRIALRLLKRVADFVVVAGTGIVGQAEAAAALARLEVDQLGLDSNDLRYLNLLANYYQGGPVGIDTLAAGLSEDRDTIEDNIEPYLMQQGFVKRTPRGRVLCERAYLHLQLPIPSGLTQLSFIDDN